MVLTTGCYLCEEVTYRWHVRWQRMARKCVLPKKSGSPILMLDTTEFKN